MQLDEQTMNFLKEREERLGAKIILRTYALFYLSGSGEKREYGVFIYSDGNTIVFEDFDRPPTFLGIELKRKNKEKYVKLERSFLISDVESACIVSRTSAIDSVRRGGEAKESGSFTKAFRKTLLEIKLKDGTKYYFELINSKEFIDFIKKEGKYERIQSL